MTPVWANATHVCTVEVDVETGKVGILRYIVAEDCGPMINPSVVEGQIAGGTLQGIGGALLEHLAYDGDGTPVAASFLDYLVPTAVESPTIEYGHVETDSETPGGYKGVGEGGAIGAPAAVVNAVVDALVAFGAESDPPSAQPGGRRSRWSTAAEPAHTCYPSAGLGRVGSCGRPESRSPLRRRNVIFRVCSRQPVISSHSVAKSVVNYPRSISDEVIKAIAQSGGVCSINMVGAFVDLSNPDIVTTDMLFRHIDYMVNLVGIDHVGFGSDYIPDVTKTAIAAMTDLGDLFFPDGGYTKAMSAKGVPTPAPYQIVAALVDKMLENGYSEADCGKFLGGNLYRVFQQVWF